MSRRDFRACFRQRIRELHPLTINQVAAFPASQLEMPVILQNQRRRDAGNDFPFHLRLRALVTSGNIHSLRLGGRNRRDTHGSEGKIPQKARCNPYESHRGSPLPGRVAAGHRPWPLVQVQLARQACTLQSTYNKRLSKPPDLYLAVAGKFHSTFSHFGRTLLRTKPLRLHLSQAPSYLLKG